MTDTTQTAPRNAVVWAELPVSDLGAGMAFYSALLGTQMTTMEMGGDTVSAFPYGDGGVSGGQNAYVAARDADHHTSLAALQHYATRALCKAALARPRPAAFPRLI